MSAIVLGGRPIGVADVVAVARMGARVELAADARARMAASHAVLERAAAGGQRIYGATTGLGPNTGLTLAADEPERGQRILAGRAVGMGPPASAELVRAALFVRVAGLAAGGSGVSPEIAECLLALLDRNVLPVVPTIGSVGMADLAPLAHLALPLVGLGRAELDGELLEGAEALARAGIARPPVSPREGLALCSSNAFAIGAAALAAADAARLLDTANATVALMLEGFGGNPSPTDPRVVAARPFPGHAWAAAGIRAQLAGSGLLEPGGPRLLQDPLPLRCAAVVHGSARAAIERLLDAVDLELASALDNPLVVEDDDGQEVVGSAGFDSVPLAHALEAVSLALASVARISASRTLQSHDGRRTDLPDGLSPVGGDRAGLGVLGKTVGALSARIRSLALPVSLEALPLARGIEDHASHAPLAALRLAQLLDELARVIACELVCAAQAFDLRAARSPGAGAAATHARVRALVPRLEDDRVLGDELEGLARSIR